MTSTSHLMSLSEETIKIVQKCVLILHLECLTGSKYKGDSIDEGIFFSGVGILEVLFTVAPF